MLSTNNNPQLKDSYSHLITFLEKTREPLLAYSPSEALSATLADQQVELEVFNQLTKLVTLANEFSREARKNNQADIRSSIQNHPIDLAVSTTREEYHTWADELDARGVELWNRASQLRRILDSQRSSNTDYIQSNKLYHSALRTLHQKNSSPSKLPQRNLSLIHI